MKVISKNDLLKVLGETLTSWRYNKLEFHVFSWVIVEHLIDQPNLIAYGDFSRFLDNYVSSKMANRTNNFIDSLKGEVQKKCYDE